MYVDGRDRAVGAVSNERWTMARSNAVPTQNCRSEVAKWRPRVLGYLSREGDRKERRSRSTSCKQIRGGRANYV